MISRRGFIAAAAGCAGARSASAAVPYGATPSERQLRWHELEFTGFLHFTVNTFTDKEWGYGDENPDIFNPAKFDADAICGALADARMRGVILTCKHHDGFCLWPTKTTEHSVAKSSWRGGQGDVVREISQAARRRGLKFGVYLSPWDRNSAEYGKPGYVEIYRRQLTELLTGYGEIFEVWHDGANGGDGYYGGAREKRTIDKNSYYQWPGTWELVRRLQPGAVIFSDVGPDVRWVGNERGIAGDPCWATFDPVGADGGPASPGNVREKESPAGHRHGSKWLPPECDVSIRPGWFWHERENARVKTPNQLVDLFYQSVGRGATLLLNVPPNRDGLLSAEDVASLKGFGGYLRGTFGKDLAAGAKKSVNPAGDVTLDFRRPVSFDVIRIREDIRYGQRIDAVAVESWSGGQWEAIAQATSVGARRLIRLEKAVNATRLRVRVTQAAATPLISEFAVFAQAAAG